MCVPVAGQPAGSKERREIERPQKQGKKTQQEEAETHPHCTGRRKSAIMLRVASLFPFERFDYSLIHPDRVRFMARNGTAAGGPLPLRGRSGAFFRLGAAIRPSC